MEGSRSRRLAEILGRVEDVTLRVVGISVNDDVVRVTLRCADGVHVEDYRAEEARRVMADLMYWSGGRDGV